MKRNNLPAIVMAILLFGLGVGVGALAHRYYSPTVVVANSPESFRQSLISEMRSKLSLSSSQVATLHDILDRTKTEMKAVHDRTHPEMVKIKEEQIASVKAMLSPAQVSAYDRLLAERERRFHEQEARERVEDQKRKGSRGTGVN